MHDVHLEVLKNGIALHQQGKFGEAEVIYNKLLNRFPFETDVLYLLADIDLRREYNGRAINLLCNLLQNAPQHAEAWCNLGCAFRKENEYQKAEAAWRKALSLKETAEVFNNLATLYADSARPHEAIAWLDKALEREPENVTSRFQKSLALLTLKRWEDGWQFYEARRSLETWDSRPTVEAPPWNGEHVDHLYIHGEQGVGDEIMFASAVPSVLARAGRITLEVHAKVAGIAKQTWPDFTVVKEESPGKYDAKIPIGSLMGMFGMNTKPYLKPHPKKVAWYRRQLKKLGPGPYVALTWCGGTKATRVEDRSMRLSDLQPIRDAFTCVSAQYTDTNPTIESERVKRGLPMINAESAGLDLHDQAALLKAVDAVVTVQQTAVHVAGGVGAKTHAIIGPRPHWRYGIEGDSLPFYSSVRLHRRKEGSDWAEVVERVRDALNRDLQRTEPRAA